MASLILGFEYDIFIIHLQRMGSNYQAEHERVRKWLEEQDKL